ncbi:hypothetical protein H4219_001993 [Mycoemilia scoparia]|uniref:DUF3533 domain-containing protein n=1 Tax=Mycoemilia scoparia TaxID=417184 RepID=A0A9W8A4I4_9FUNG|nr:hypothetical protein H4219_001993 [Mycoemilia scoparia]
MSVYFVDLPERVGFWDTALSYSRKVAGKYLLRQIITLTLTIWAALGLFFGANFKTTDYLHNIHIGVYNMDGGDIGGMLSSGILDAMKLQGKETFELVSIDRFNNVDEIAEDIRKNGWGGIVIGANLTDSIRNALENGTPFDTTNKLYAMYSEGRQPIVRNAKDIINNGGSPHTGVALSPIQPKIMNVAPFSFPAAPLFPIIGFIVLYLFLMIPSVVFRSLTYPVSMQVSFPTLFIWKFTILFAWNFFVALFGALAFFAFKGPNYEVLDYGLPFTAGRWFAVFGIFLGLTTSTILFFNAGIAILPVDLLGTLSLLFVLSNVASSLVDVSIAPPFYKWLEVLPFHLAGNLIRYVISGAHPRLGRDIGIFLGEVAFWFVAWILIEYVRYLWVNSGKQDASGWFYGYFLYMGPGYPRGVTRELTEENEEQEPPVAESTKSPYASPQSEPAQSEKGMERPSNETLSPKSYTTKKSTGTLMTDK